MTNRYSDFYFLSTICRGFLMFGAMMFLCVPQYAEAQDNAEQMINDYIEQAPSVTPPNMDDIMPVIPQIGPDGKPIYVEPTNKTAQLDADVAPTSALPPSPSTAPTDAPLPLVPDSQVPPDPTAAAAALPLPVPPPAAEAPPVVAPADTVVPAEAQLATPLLPPVPVAEQPKADVADENLFFDAEAYVPAGSQMSPEGATIKKVSPKLEPASRFVLVKKDFDPSSERATLTSADRALKLGRYEAALELYDQAYAKDNKDVNVMMGRALALQHMERTTEAILAYQEVLDHNPDNVPANVNMLGLMSKQYPAVAMRRLTELKSSQPNNASVYAQLAVTQANVGNYKQALEQLGVAAGIEPTNPSHVYNMAIISDRAGDQGSAVKYYEQALELDAVYGGSRSIPRDAVFERLAQIR